METSVGTGVLVGRGVADGAGVVVGGTGVGAAWVGWAICVGVAVAGAVVGLEQAANTSEKIMRVNNTG